jgi:VanZ family protein
MKLQRAWLVLGWAGVAAIIILSLIPSPPTIHIEQGDKLGHALAYAAVMAWFGQAYLTSSRRGLTAALLVCLGVALEFVQGWTGYRDFSYADMVADSFGILLGWLLSPPRVPDLLRRLSASTP